MELVYSQLHLLPFYSFNPEIFVAGLIGYGKLENSKEEGYGNGT
jgi:hypothetical protein